MSVPRHFDCGRKAADARVESGETSSYREAKGNFGTTFVPGSSGVARLAPFRWCTNNELSSWSSPSDFLRREGLSAALSKTGPPYMCQGLLCLEVRSL
jgi:hypothetical protein